MLNILGLRGERVSSSSPLLGRSKEDEGRDQPAIEFSGTIKDWSRFLQVSIKTVKR